MSMVTTSVPKGIGTITPYLVVQDAPALIDFVTRVFEAEEGQRAIGSAGGIHAAVYIGDSMLMIGGGAPNLRWRGESQPTALHVYVKDADDTYERALRAGAMSLQPPIDHEYGERSGCVKDVEGNHWYIATWRGEHYVPDGLRTVNVFLHPLRAEPLITFMQGAFDAEVIDKYASPDGVVHHAKVRIGETTIEMGEAHGPYQPMPTMFYVDVSDVEATYRQALAAGGASLGEPADRPDGARTAAVTDPFGNQWYIASALTQNPDVAV